MSNKGPWEHIPGQDQIRINPPGTPNRELLKLWKPQRNLPWRALKKGSDDYIWYTILDSYGDEICSFGAVRPGEEHDEIFRHVVFILTCINTSRHIQINDRHFAVEWGAETQSIDL